MPLKTGMRRRYSMRIALSVQPTSVTDSWVTRLRMPLAIFEETRRTQVSCRRARTPLTTSKPSIRSSRTRDVRRVVLEVRVQGDDDAAAGVAEAGVERRRLAAVAALAHDAESAGLPARAGHHRGARVGAAVVDVGSPRRDGPTASTAAMAARISSGEHRQVLLLVVDRDDHRDLRLA